MICIGRQNYFLLISYQTFDSDAQMCCTRYHFVFSTFSLKIKCKICVQKELIHNFKNHILGTRPATNLPIVQFQKISRPLPRREFQLGNDTAPLESDFTVQPPSLLEFPGPLTPPPPAPTPLEVPIPSVVGVWIFSGTTHFKKIVQV